MTPAHPPPAAASCATPAACWAGAALPALANQPETRSLAFSHTHTGEQLALTYAIDAHYLPDSLAAFNLRRCATTTREVGSIDPQLFDLLHQLQLSLGEGGAFEVISGYRCPATNTTLRNTRGGGVARRSLHMDGKAIDIRLPGVPSPACATPPSPCRPAAWATTRRNSSCTSTPAACAGSRAASHTS
jgi:uncharacterized protein YcbK (DUF882 family)